MIVVREVYVRLSSYIIGGEFIMELENVKEIAVELTSEGVKNGALKFIGGAFSTVFGMCLFTAGSNAYMNWQKDKDSKK